MPKPFDEGYIIAGADNNSFPDKVTAVNGCLGGLIPKAINVDMRFYLKFKNIDTGDISEFMRTYKADVTHKHIYGN
jgi:hypothetical protein